MRKPYSEYTPEAKAKKYARNKRWRARRHAGLTPTQPSESVLANQRARQLRYYHNQPLEVMRERKRIWWNNLSPEEQEEKRRQNSQRTVKNAKKRSLKPTTEADLDRFLEQFELESK